MTVAVTGLGDDESKFTITTIIKAQNDIGEYLDNVHFSPFGSHTFFLKVIPFLIVYFESKAFFQFYPSSSTELQQKVNPSSLRTYNRQSTKNNNGWEWLTCFAHMLRYITIQRRFRKKLARAPHQLWDQLLSASGDYRESRTSKIELICNWTVTDTLRYHLTRPMMSFCVHSW